MLYFLVNNNFHLIDVEKHLEDLKDQKTALIKIPHKLTISPKHSFEVQMEFPILIGGIRDYFNLLRIFLLHKKIRTALKNIQPTDVLIFYTEYEFSTHYIVNQFKKKKAKVILIEEGFPTYLTFTGVPDSSLSVKDFFLGCYLQFVLGYRNSKIVSINKSPTTMLSDNQIDQLLLYTNIKIKRNIQTGLLVTKKIKFNQLNDHTVLFLNEGIYGHYVSFNEYIRILEDILSNLSVTFELVYFKFHPRESEESRKMIKSIIEKYTKVIVINDNRPVELMIDQIGAKYIVSFLAQTLLYLSNSNCILIYIFHLYPKLMQNAVFMQVKNVIDGMDYIFMDDWSEIKNKVIGFVQQSNSDSQILQTYLE